MDQQEGHDGRNSEMRGIVFDYADIRSRVRGDPLIDNRPARPKLVKEKSSSDDQNISRCIFFGGGISGMSNEQIASEIAEWL